MNNILVVLNNDDTSKVLMEKAFLLAPRSISLMLVDVSDADEANIHQQVSALCEKYGMSNENCIYAKAASTSQASLTQLVEVYVKENRPELILLRKPNLVKYPEKMDDVKSLIRNSTESHLLFCKNVKWKTPPEILCSLDIDDDTPAQDQLNDKIYGIATETFGQGLNANLHLSTIIAMSRINEELEIVQPDEVMMEKGQAYLKDLEAIANTKTNMGVQLHVTAGIPAKEITSLTKKEHIDLTMMGNVGRKGLSGLVIGNTAEKIFKTLESDVLLVHTEASR